MLTNAELLNDIQAEIGESSSECVELLGDLTSVESCDTLLDLRISLLKAKLAAMTIIQNINDQLARMS